MGFFDKLKSGLAKTRNNITVKIEQVFGAYKELDDDFFDELEEALIIADVGVPTASYAIETLRKRIFEKRIKSTDGAKDELVWLDAGRITVKGQTSGEWVSLGEYDLQKDKPCYVEFTNGGKVTGQICADAVLVVKNM